MPIFWIVLISINLLSCGTERAKSKRKNNLQTENQISETSEIRENDNAWIVKAGAVLSLDITSQIISPSSKSQIADAMPNKEGIKVFLKASVSHPIATNVDSLLKFETDSSDLAVPEEISAAILNFGRIRITKLLDNNLNTCGEDEDEPCSEAMIRVFTTGTERAGFWNLTGNYGIPILINSNEVGLEESNALELYKINIGDRRSLRIQEFAEGASRISLPVQIDFSNAGAGSYSTNIVVEYLLR